MLALALGAYQARASALAGQARDFDASLEALHAVDALVTHRVEEAPQWGSAALDAVRRRVVARSLDPVLLQRADFGALRRRLGLARLAYAVEGETRVVFEAARAPPCRRVLRLVRVQGARAVLEADFCRRQAP